MNRLAKIGYYFVTVFALHLGVPTWARGGETLTAHGIEAVSLSPEFLRWQLSLDLVVEADHDGAALEFRRQALEESCATVRGAFDWLAAYEYAAVKHWDAVANLLGDAEKQDPGLMAESGLLRAEMAMARKEYASAAYFLSRTDVSAMTDLKRYAARRKAVAEIKADRILDARKSLINSPGDESKGLAELDQYARRKHKSPVIGGLLGFVPGMGYAYSEEYLNAVRSAILNSIFIFGMSDTARKDQWGAFAVITFFEITWYSGSIYGGIDASYRFNQNQLQQVESGIMDGASYVPDLGALPTLRLKFRF